MASDADYKRYLETLRAGIIKQALDEGDDLLWTQSVWHIRGIETKPYSIATFPYLREPLESKVPTMTVMSSSGTGKTEGFLGWAMARGDRGRRVLYAMESDDKVGLIVKERVNPNLQFSPYLGRRCTQTDNIKLKMFPTGFNYYMGLGTHSSVTSIHVDDAVLDELDLMDADNVAAVEKRLTTAPDPYLRFLSNPWNEGGGIHKKFLEGDQRLWVVPCPTCKAELPLDWDTHVDYVQGLVRCPHCFKPMDRLAPGYWKVTNPGPVEHSYHMHGLMSPELKLPETCKELLSDDMAKVKAAWRFNKGVPFRFKDGGLSDVDLHAADGGAHWTKYAPGGHMHIDPGGLFDVQIYQKTEKGLPERCTWYGTVKGWRELRLLVDESQVTEGTIDFGPEEKAALEFCQDMVARGHDFRRVAYKLRETPGSPDFQLDPVDDLLIAAQRTGAIDQMVADLRKGKLKFPSRAVRNPTERWASHMKAPVRSVEKDAKGNEKGTWDEGSRPDHQFHCAVQAAIWARVPDKGRRRKVSVHSGRSH